MSEIYERIKGLEFVTSDILLNIIQRIHHQDNSPNSMSSLFNLKKSTSIVEEFNLFYSFQDRSDISFYFQYFNNIYLLRINSPESLFSYWLNLGIEGSEVFHDLGLSNQQVNHYFKLWFLFVQDVFIKRNGISGKCLSFFLMNYNIVEHCKSKLDVSEVFF